MRKRTPEGISDANTGKDRQFVEALAKGLQLLRAFRQGDLELSNQDFVSRVGLPKATASRLTYTLSKLGYLSYNSRTGGYRLDAPAMSLGYTYLAGVGIRRLAKPSMQALADHAGAPVALGAKDHLSMVYLECCRSANAITLAIEVGAHIKLASSSLGRAYIAGLPPVERNLLLDQLADHEGPDWPALSDGIAEAMESYEKFGYCLSVGNWKSDVNSVGVPYRPKDGSPVLAFNCGGPSFLLDRDRLTDDIGPRLVAMVRDLENNIPLA
ncbi:DNA-binding IclR family transcriptional regulator [Neorhizobium galegae]|uniref:IclR family transcriptional regulator n=1 Tax=Neorhizobium galegae TaxID=399 RepID=UPI00278460E7|nr:IclR family transcriptional regulator [Neorhizobium galegae]MDQ0138065.1 DNA-binding IclR family transcriptional regulator [Neorhizobium galegae]